MKTTIRLRETTLERRGRPGWKELLPKEHGVWAWLGLPLVLALGLAPTVSTLLATCAVVSGFGAAQGWGRAMRGARGAAVPTLIALLCASLFGLGAVASAVRPGVLVATLLSGGGVGLFGMSFLRGLAPRQVGFELAAITGFVAIGAGIAVSGGADREHIVVAALALGAWLVLGLWWIKRMLAAVLKHREPWANGVWFGAGATALSLAFGMVLGFPWVGALPVLYVARITFNNPATVARDAKRIGLTELAWGIGIALAAALL